MLIHRGFLSLAWLVPWALLGFSGKLLAQETPSLRVLSLREALALAREHQPLLRRARANVDVANADAQTALAPMLPQLLGTASYQRTTANFVPRPGFVPNTTAQAASGGTTTATLRKPDFDTFNFYNLGLTANQLITDFGQSRGNYRAAKELALAQKDTARATQLDVEFNVRSAFFRARAMKELVSVAQESLANQQRHLAQAQAFVDVGTRPEIDLAQVRTEVANARVQLIQAENGYAIGKAALNQAIGVDALEDYEVAADTLPELPEEGLPREDVWHEALRLRPELAALERQARAQRLYLRAARGGYGPALSASSSFTDAGLKLGDLIWNWNAGVLLSWPLYEGGATQAAVRTAQANHRGALADQAALRQAVRFEVEQARLDVRAAKAVREAADEALINARERLKLAEGRYAAGVGNVIELGDAQLALTSAEAQRVQAEFNLAVARASLLNALGKTE